jgi:mannosylglycerate hydrolase
MTETSKSVGLIVAHSHWDREWRYPIWKNRMLLVEMLDGLLETLENEPRYGNFVLDGQCVALEDYLEVRPERADRVRAQIAAGRLSIGPWYTLPDLYPLDGECLVRNLLKGTRLAKKFGGCLHVGYNSFGWGQTAQFPQIYKEFGIDFVIAAKNVSRQRAPHCEYWWESPDGTRVLATRLGQHARANFFFNAYLPVCFGMEYLSEQYRLDWAQAGTVIHRADSAEAYRDHFRVARQRGWHDEPFCNAIEAAWKAMDDTLLPDFRLLMSGSDFTACQPELPRIIEEANRRFPEREFRHGTLEEYAEHLKTTLDPSRPEVVRGELRDGPPQAASANALATRITIKQLNKQAENLLLCRAEPLACLMAMQGAEYPRSFIELAWRHLLLAHPHDSLNGVTQDKTAADTEYRIHQAIELADAIFEKAAAELVSRIDLSAYAPEDVLLVLINPLSHPVRDVVKLCVDTPQEQKVWDFTAIDAEGNALAVQQVGRQEKTSPVNDLDARPWPFYLDRHTVHLETGEVPAGGYKVVKIVPRNTFYRKTEFWALTRTTPPGAIAASPHTLENEFLKVEISLAGTIDLLDKTTGRWHRGLLHFEDTGDVGDYWIYYPPYENRTCTSLGSPARIWLEDSGPLAATVGIAVNMSLPAFASRPENYVRGESCRSGEMRDLTITSWITLKKGQQHVEVKTQVDNTVRDHRLRLMLPCGVRAQAAAAAGHFTVDRRPAVPELNPQGEYWPEMQTLPMQSFIDISDGQHGLAVLNNCFTEYEAIDGEQTTLAITLFRAVKNIICTEFRAAGAFPDQDGGQLQTRLEYRYAIVPHRGDWRDADLFRQAQSFNAPPVTIQTSCHRTGSLPPQQGLFALKSAAQAREQQPEAQASGNQASGLVLSAFKKAEDRETYIVRLYNPTDATAAAAICLAGIKAAWRTTLDEVRCEPLAVEAGGQVRVSAAPGKIVTIELEMV